MRQTSQHEPASETTDMSANATERAKNIFVVLSTVGSLLGLIVGILANVLLQ